MLTSTGPRCALFVTAVALCAGSASAVIVPDNGFGTARIPPPSASYGWSATTQPWAFSNGLPSGAAITATTATWGNFTYGTDVPGGTLGGQQQNFASDITLSFVGSGAFLGYSRTITLPVVTGETHTGPRGPAFSSPQNFGMVLWTFQAQIFSDVDFDLLRITAGNGFGMASPGSTTLTGAGPGLWNVDSFFDITYRIDFIGKPGGPFGGMSGSTNGAPQGTRMFMGVVPAPGTVALLGLGALVGARRRRR